MSNLVQYNMFFCLVFVVGHRFRGNRELITKEQRNCFHVIKSIIAPSLKEKTFLS